MATFEERTRINGESTFDYIARALSRLEQKEVDYTKERMVNKRLMIMNQNNRNQLLALIYGIEIK